MKEIAIDYKEISNPQTITQVIENKFKENGLNLHTHEVEKLEDDHRKGVRHLQVKNSKYFMVRVPWKE